MTKSPPTPPPSVDSPKLAVGYQKTLYGTLDRLSPQLRDINLQIHSNPELCYNEYLACETLVHFLRQQGLQVTERAFGLETSFQSEFGSGGRVITFCAEYDALPEIGHACGHNLIATASTAAFLGVVSALRDFKLEGRVRLLGCPAEEGGGGKIKLIKAGAFDDVNAALMVHPMQATSTEPTGVAYGTCLAATGFKASFEGKASHAGVLPWLGVNALDAASLAYTAVGFLRQQCRPTDRINVVTNRDSSTGCGVITDKTSIEFGIRCATLAEVRALEKRVTNCIEGAALATSCSVSYTQSMEPYADLRPNETMCIQFTNAMAELGTEFLCDIKSKDVKGYGTDMGNVSYKCPSLHAIYTIPTSPGQDVHSAGFALAASTMEAHNTTLKAAKGMGLTGLTVLLDDVIAKQVADDFIRDKGKRHE